MLEPLYRLDAYQKTTKAVVLRADDGGIVLNQTLFYPLGGGQPGDQGFIKWKDHEARVVDTRKIKQENGFESILHILEPNKAFPEIKGEVEITLDWERRYKHMRMHTCLHLLSSLFRESLVTGGQIGADKGRLDFNISSDQLASKESITENLNDLILNNHDVEERWISDEELQNNPDLIRTMSVKPPIGYGRVRLLSIGPGIDLQPCGGTHVKKTAEIGKVEVVKIENKGKQNRRVIVAFKG